jgi:hypothetical protein
MVGGVGAGLAGFLFSGIRQRSSPHPGIDTADCAAASERAPLCFLSYSSPDKAVVHRVAATLLALSIECWLDEWEILPGDTITKKISIFRLAWNEQHILRYSCPERPRGPLGSITN